MYWREVKDCKVWVAWAAFTITNFAMVHRMASWAHKTLTHITRFETENEMLLGDRRFVKSILWNLMVELWLKRSPHIQMKNFSWLHGTLHFGSFHKSWMASWSRPLVEYFAVSSKVWHLNGPQDYLRGSPPVTPPSCTATGSLQICLLSIVSLLLGCRLSNMSFLAVCSHCSHQCDVYALFALKSICFS